MEMGAHAATAQALERLTRMDRTERFYKIDQLLQTRRPVVPVAEFLDELGISLATFKRDLEYMRERLNAPIIWDRDQNGYRFEAREAAGPKYELPGLWFTPKEAQALLTMERLIEGIEPSLLGPHLEPLKARLAALLSTGDHSAREVRSRIRVLPMAMRRHEPKHFSLVAAAVLGRQRLRLDYWNRAKDEASTREVSPQRLVHYRDNWYLDAWCHLRKDIRSFALDAMRSVELVAAKARDVPEDELDAVLASGYGIFAGKKVQWAVLRFTPERARYVALEEWHPKQKVRWERDGSYVLEVPFTSAIELLKDILAFGPDVEVVSPPELRAEAVSRLEKARARYR
jgi:predicted DNA-binding transcriptional regulator YafY